ncbi:hypothetical protein M513_00889, partial [Trichuris suis]
CSSQALVTASTSENWTKANLFALTIPSERRFTENIEKRVCPLTTNTQQSQQEGAVELRRTRPLFSSIIRFFELATTLRTKCSFTQNTVQKKGGICLKSSSIALFVCMMEEVGDESTETTFSPVRLSEVYLKACGGFEMLRKLLISSNLENGKGEPVLWVSPTVEYLERSIDKFNKALKEISAQVDANLRSAITTDFIVQVVEEAKAINRSTGTRGRRGRGRSSATGRPSSRGVSS